MLDNLKQEQDVQEEKDSLGGFTKPSGLYKANIKTAYLSTSSGGAQAVNIAFGLSDSSELTQTIYVTSGDAKGNKTFYVTPDNKKRNLPGFNIMNNMVQLALDKELGDLDTEEKVVGVYDYDAKKNINTKVPMLTELTGKAVILGLLEVIDDKRAKNTAGVYVPTGETRKSNEIERVFHATSQLTHSEIRDGVTEPDFINKWSDKWTGKTKDKSTKGASPTAAGTTTRTTPSLF